MCKLHGERFQTEWITTFKPQNRGIIMHNDLINIPPLITDELTLRLIENKRVRHCRECTYLETRIQEVSLTRVLKCALYPAMDDMVECYRFNKVN